MLEGYEGLLLADDSISEERRRESPIVPYWDKGMRINRAKYLTFLKQLVGARIFRCHQDP
eukprot:7562615-Heterocapsa_arctica.AAC.1